MLIVNLIEATKVNNPTKRNRNIGTAKQGFGQNNKLTIPQPSGMIESFYERLGDYQKIKSIINDHEFLFIVELTRSDSKHSCSVADLIAIIEQIPKEDYGELKFIVLRQPKRKEETLSPTWGRLIYSYKFEHDNYPAIILEAVDLTRKFKWKKNLSVEDQKEIARLIEDGHKIENDGRLFVAEFELENIRNTQLYRTLPHEFGHYVQYLEFVERPAKEDEDYEIWEERLNKYLEIPKAEKEKFAHKYANKLKTELTRKKIIPFEQK